ncbi:uncharacterized protein TNCV_1389881 [Trichonephila clavipes]|nr:uncharacterized protein TNCV_1389881 [Trichonephila clavipes]
MRQQALATNTLSSYTHDYPTLPADVAEAIYPIYKDFNIVELLEKCIGGFTQNNNESYNSVNIWEKTPKSVPCGSKIVEIAAYIAAGMFNEGTKSLFCTGCFQMNIGVLTLHSIHDILHISMTHKSNARTAEKF